MRFRLKRLNAQGVAHHALIAILVISAFASFGAYRVFSSNAMTADSGRSAQQEKKKKQDQVGKGDQTAREYEQELRRQEQIKQQKQKQQADKQKSEAQKQAEKERAAREAAAKAQTAKEQAAKERAAKERADRERAAKEAERKRQEQLQKKEEEQRKKDANANCSTSQINLNNKCVTRKNCKADERLTSQNTCEKKASISGSDVAVSQTSQTPTTGGPRCIPGTTLSADRKSCVCPEGQNLVNSKCQTISGTPEQIKAQCRAAGRDYDVAKNNCSSECRNGFELVGAGCQVKKTEDQIKAACATQFLNYDKKSKACSSECKTDYKKNKQGLCVEVKTAEEVKASCDVKFLKYDKENNKCRNECKDNFTKTGNVCTTDQPTDVVKALCAAEGKNYDKETNACKAECKEGYATAVIDNPQAGTSSVRCAPRNLSTDDQKKAQCAAQFLKWNPVKKECKPECKEGFTTQADGTCAVEELYRQLKAACDALYKRFNNETKTCVEDSCKLGFTKTEEFGCIQNEEYQGKMNAQRCASLGRQWLYAEYGSESSGFCTSLCLDATGEYRSQGSPDTSYCVGNNPLLSVSETLNKDDCTAQNRVFNYLSQVCVPRCKVGFTIAVSNPAEESKDPAAVTCTPTTPSDNGGEASEEGGCTEGAEVDEATGLCPGDVEVGQGDPTVATLDTTIDRATCALLGREWEPGSKGQGGEKVRGCKIDECADDKVSLVKPESGTSFCKGHIAKMEKDRCDDLNRKWVEEAQGCAATPKASEMKNGKRIVGANICADKKLVYLATDGADACVSPSRIDRLRQIARSTGVPFAQVVNMSRAGLCNINPTKHWNGTKCIQDKNGVDANSNDPMIIVDSFGQTTDKNAEQYKLNYVDCTELQKLATAEQAKSFSCVSADVCTEQGGVQQNGAIIANGQANMGVLCWTADKSPVTSRYSTTFGQMYDSAQTKVVTGASCDDMKNSAPKQLTYTLSCGTEQECKDAGGTFYENVGLYIGKDTLMVGPTCATAKA